MDSPQTEHKLDRLLLGCGMLALMGLVQFTCSVVYAILACQGGFNFAEHFVSDLGRTDSPASQFVFNRVVIVLGCTMMPFFLLLHRAVDHLKLPLCFSGVLACCGLIGIGLTPYDVYLVAHHKMQIAFALGTLAFVIMFLVAAVERGLATTTLAATTYLVIGGIAGFALYTGEGVPGVRTVYVLIQKIMIISIFVWFGLTIYTVTMSVFHPVVRPGTLPEPLPMETAESR